MSMAHHRLAKTTFLDGTKVADRIATRRRNDDTPEAAGMATG
jgi:hypothetical protein